MNMESRTYTEDDLDLAQVQVRRTRSERSWSELQQQKPPQVIHYKPVGKASKEVVRVCFILVNTLHSPYERFGKHRRYRATWESAFPTPTELGDNFFRHNTSAAKFINEASSGKVAFSGTVVGWFNDTAHGPISATKMFHDRNRYFLLARKAVLHAQSWKTSMSKEFRLSASPLLFGSILLSVYPHLDIRA